MKKLSTTSTKSLNSKLQTQISLLLSKYKNIETVEDLIYLLNKEFKTSYNSDDLLNYYTSLTELEIENRKIENGYFDQHGDAFELNFDC